MFELSKKELKKYTEKYKKTQVHKIFNMNLFMAFLFFAIVLLMTVAVLIFQVETNESFGLVDNIGIDSYILVLLLNVDSLFMFFYTCYNRLMDTKYLLKYCESKEK